jgi:TolA-binding protein
MKFFKLSKTSWLILSAGLFIVVLAGLGITRSQQSQEQNKISDQLTTAQKSLEKLNSTDLAQQLEELNQQTDEAKVQLEEAQSRLRQTVVSVDVTDKFYSIADYCGVIVTNYTSTPIQSAKFANVGLSTTSINTVVRGDFEQLVNFIVALNNDFNTAQMKAYMMNIPDGDEELPSVTVQMVIFSYEGK